MTVEKFPKKMGEVRSSDAESEEGTTSELAYAVGLNHLSYDGRCFKEYFRVPPSTGLTQEEYPISTRIPFLSTSISAYLPLVSGNESPLLR